MRALHILVIDDNQKWRETLALILRRHLSVVQVDTASNYGEALQYIRNGEYDLMTVDLALLGEPVDPQNADQQGFDLIKVVRETQGNRHCGVIVLTAFGNIERTKHALRDYEVYDFIEKGQFNAQLFVEIARSTIRNAWLSSAEAQVRACLRLIITFSQDHLISIELIDPDRLISLYNYIATNPQSFNFADLSRRTDDLNLSLLRDEANTWRPEAKSIGIAIYEAFSREQGFQKGLNIAEAFTKQFGAPWIEFRGPAIGLSIPFELLHNGNDYLIRTHILTRRLLQVDPTLLHRTLPFHRLLKELLKNREKLRILIVGANSDGNIPGAESEAKMLHAAIISDLQQLGIDSDITMLMGSDASCTNVINALRNEHYHIFHYAGHGRYNDTLPEISGLILYDGILSAATLNNILLHDTDLYMVFLSCCLGARNGSQVGRGDFHGMLEAIASANVPTILGYRWTVADESAQHLAKVFYETLWSTFSPGEALQEARSRATMGPRGRDDETWMSPVLLMQSM